MKSRARLILFLLLFLILSPLADRVWAAEVDPYLDFARHLFKKGDYYRSITEAKRFLFMRPGNARELEAKLLIARAYLGSGRYEEAREAFQPVARQNRQPDLSAEAWLGIGSCLERTRQFSKVIDFYDRLPRELELPEDSLTDVRNISLYRQGWLLMDVGQWEKARRAFDALDQGHPLKHAAAALCRLTLEAEKQPYCSPTTAGVLSVLYPGAGQLYVGRTTDAILAFAINTVFLWGSYEAGRSGSWMLFSLVGLAEMGWYGGNVYNAINGAFIHNREIRNSFLKNYRRRLAWSLAYSPTNREVARTCWLAR